MASHLTLTSWASLYFDSYASSILSTVFKCYLNYSTLQMEKKPQYYNNMNDNYTIIIPDGMVIVF